MEQAFNQMINNHRGTIFKVCNLYCTETENRKDLFQEIVLQLWKAYPSFKKESKLNTWIYRVALNTAISNLRKESRKPGSDVLREEALQLPEIPQLSWEVDRSSLLHLAINQLTAVEKALVMLYLDDNNYEEISQVLGISHSNVGVRLNRVKQKLSKLIQTTEI